MSVNIGIIGLGTVGGGVYEILMKNAELIASRVGEQVVVKKACDIRSDIRDQLAGERGGEIRSSLPDGVNHVLRLAARPAYDGACLRREYQRLPPPSMRRAW